MKRCLILDNTHRRNATGRLDDEVGDDLLAIFLAGLASPPSRGARGPTSGDELIVSGTAHARTNMSDPYQVRDGKNGLSVFSAASSRWFEVHTRLSSVNRGAAVMLLLQ